MKKRAWFGKQIWSKNVFIDIYNPHFCWTCTFHQVLPQRTNEQMNIPYTTQHVVDL